MAPYFQNAEFYVAPVFSGAGMKVKVAEALSYGLTVVGSHHALVGYEESAPFVIETNTAEEFLYGIEKVQSNPASKEQCLGRYNTLYTIQRSAADFERVFSK